MEDQGWEKLTTATKLRLAGQTKRSISEYRRLLNDPNPELQIEALNGMALCHKMEKKHWPAIKEFKTAAQIARQIGYFQRLSGLYRDIATTYEYQRKHLTADRWYQKALANLEEYGDKPLAAKPEWGITIGKKGLLYMRWNKPERAQKMLMQGLSACQKRSADFYILTLKMHLLELHNRRRQFSQTLHQVKGLISEAKSKGWDHRQAQLLIIKAVALTGAGREKNADRCWKAVDRITQQLDITEMSKAILEDKKLQMCLPNK